MAFHAQRIGSPAVFERICALLDQRDLAYEVLHHELVHGTAHAAELRGLTMAHAAKCLLMKVGKTMGVVAFPAHRRLDNRAFRAAAGVGKLRFAREEELTALTGLVRGCVPPFGEPVLPMPLWIDAALEARLQDADRRLAFTPGLLDRSIILDVADWRAAVQGTVVDASRPAG